MPSTERLVHILLATIIARPRAVLAIFLLCTVAWAAGSPPRAKLAGARAATIRGMVQRKRARRERRLPP
jgi:hypothetical protein